MKIKKIIFSALVALGFTAFIGNANAECGKVVIANKAPITGLGEGWLITPGTVEKIPEIKGMTAVEILEHPEWFPFKEDPSKGAFVGCPAGWGCQLANANLFKAFEMEKKGWVLVDPGSAAGLDGSIAKAAESGDPWIGYYWNPTSIVGKYSLIPVSYTHLRAHETRHDLV